MERKKQIVMILSLLIAVLGTALFVYEKLTADTISPYILGLLAYGWIFVAYMLINSSAHAFKRRYRGK